MNWGSTEDPVLLLVIQELRNGEVIPFECLFTVPFPDLESVNAVSVRVRERVQQHAIDYAEDRGGGTDAEAESGDAREQKSAVLQNAPDGEAKVLPENAHMGPLSAPRGPKLPGAFAGFVPVWTGPAFRSWDGGVAEPDADPRAPRQSNSTS